MRINFNNIYHRKRFWAGILLAQIILFFILSKLDFAIDFFSELFEWKKKFHIFIFSKIPFSVGDLFYTLVTIWIFYLLINIRKPQKKSLRKLLIGINIIYFIYQCFWGMLYFQDPLMNKLHQREITENDLKVLAVKYLELCKQSRKKVSEDKSGVFVIKNLPKLEKEILFLENNIDTNINNKKANKTLSIKSGLYSYFMNFTGILGYYNPFTAEAQFNPNLPATQIPFTLAHEMSHQLGYAREQEASFTAYLMAKKSNDPDLVYSMQLYVLKSLLRNISATDENFVQKTLSEFSSGMKRDRANELDFMRNNDSIITDFFGITNDLFLKSNQQEGRMTYNYFIYLVVLYEL